MESSQTSSLFSLSVEPVTKAHLSEAAKWARFLAIMGFIFLGLMVVGGIVAAAVMASSMNQYGSEYGSSGAGFMMGNFGAGMAVIYILLAVLYFFPCLFLFRFAAKTKQALASNDQTDLNLGFQNLKAMFRYMGILTIVVLAFYAIALLFGIVGAAMFS